MLTHWTYSIYILSKQKQRLSRSPRLCFSCETCARRSSILLRQTYGFHILAANARRGGSTYARRNASTIATHIRQSGELPALPTEPVVRLPPLPKQRQSRSTTNIVKDDLKATIQAHHTANTLAQGFIRVIPGEDTSNKIPQRLAVTPPTRDGGQIDGEWLNNTPEVKKGSGSIDMEHTVHSSTSLRKEFMKTELYDKLKDLNKDCDALSRLDSEIQTFAEWMQVTEEEREAAHNSFKMLGDVLKERFPDYETELHGSRATGLARPMSDIDIRLVVPHLEREDHERGPSPGRPKSKRQYRKALLDIGMHLKRNFHQYYRVGGTRPGRVPVLDIHARHYDLDIQISAISKPTEQATEFTKFFQSEYPQIKPLFVILRWWAERVQFHDAAVGGISSYLMFNMILTSITHSEELHSSQELGKQLLHFFKFWSTADVLTLGYAPDPARTFPKFASNIVEADLIDKEDEAEISVFDPAAAAADNQDVGFSGNDQDAHITEVNDKGDAIVGGALISSAPNPARKHDFVDVSPADDIQQSDAYLEGIKMLSARARSQLKNRTGGETRLILQDPANPQNNIGASATRFVAFQERMKVALQLLTQNMILWDEQSSEISQPSIDIGSNSMCFLLETLLGADDDSVIGSFPVSLRSLERRRRRLRQLSFKSNG